MNLKEMLDMKDEDLRRLLRRPEDPTLEFKRELHKVHDPNGAIKRREKDELIRDVLALANGNAITAGGYNYLIVGADNRLKDDNTRDLFDIGEHVLTENQILEIVNSACEPALENIRCQTVLIDGKRLLVISIPPSPHVYETTKKLSPSSADNPFTEHVVFTRRNEGIFVASAKERAAIQDLKRLRYNERRNAPPVRFGAFIGGMSGALAFIPVGERITILKDGKDIGSTARKTVTGIAGAVVGAGLGAVLGQAYKEYTHTVFIWHRLPLQAKIGMILSLPISVVVGWLAKKALTYKRE